jgi:hypothetical protein
LDTTQQTIAAQYLLAALLSEGIETLAAEMQQLSALGVAQFLPGHQRPGLFAHWHGERAVAG